MFTEDSIFNESFVKRKLIYFFITKLSDRGNENVVLNIIELCLDFELGILDSPNFAPINKRIREN